MNLLTLLRRWFPHPGDYEISGIELGPATITHIGATWLGHELERINAPINLPDGYTRIGDYIAQLEAEPGGAELVRDARARVANIAALVEFPVGRFTALTRKWAGRT